MEFVKELQKRGELPFRYAKLGRWTGKTTVRDEGAKNGLRTAETEIDLLGVNREATNYLVGECKFKGGAFQYSEYLDTMAKLTDLKKENVRFYYALFSDGGFDKKIIEEAGEGLRLYSSEDIVNRTAW